MTAGRIGDTDERLRDDWPPARIPFGSEPKPAARGAGLGGAMNIGEAARVSGVSTKMIRYYEQIALIRPADRTDGNYRNFSERDITDLKFVRRARSLGFSIETIADLLSLWRDSHARSDIEAIVAGHVSDLRSRISEMQEMVDTLMGLTERRSEERPD